MRTIIRLDASDIDKQDPMHSAVLGGFIIGMLLMTTLEDKSKTEGTLREVVAQFLNTLSEAGFTIVKSEVLPDA